MDVTVQPYASGGSPQEVVRPGVSPGPAKEDKPRGSLACTHCRRQKLRCDYGEKQESQSTPICSRCLRLGKECTAVPAARGRKLGSKNKPKLAKDEDSGSSPPLHYSPARNALSLDYLTHPTSQTYTNGHVMVPSQEQMEVQNPLAVLAEASHTAQTPLLNRVDLPNGHLPTPVKLTIDADTPRLGLRLDGEVLQEGLSMLLDPAPENPARTRPPSRQGYFTQRPQGEGKRDLGPHLDPIDLHLLEPEDADRLFASYFLNDNCCAPVLDEQLHTPSYCRARSALLLTAVCLSAAQMLPGEASITYRLRKHAQFLRQEIYVRNYRSLEILQGFDVLALWPQLQEHVDEDRSNLSLAHAIAIAYELGLDKEGRHIATPGDFSIQEQREKRSRERAMISLFIYDRTFSAATGSTWMLPDAFLPPAVHDWDRHSLAAPGDAKLLQHAFLRQETSFIQMTLKRELSKGGDTTGIPKILLELYHDRLGRWLFEFHQRVRAGAVPPVQEANMRMLYFTSCVWMLACGLPYTTRDEASQSLIAALQNAALEACENLVMHQEALNHAPFNLAVLVLYAALMSLKLHQAHGAPEALAPLLGLLAQVARWLERTGSTPSHRLGGNALYGQHLMQILRAAAHAAQQPAPAKMATDDERPWPDVQATQINGYTDQFLTLDWLSSALPIDVAAAMSDWLPTEEFASREYF